MQRCRPVVAFVLWSYSPSAAQNITGLPSEYDEYDGPPAVTFDSQDFAAGNWRDGSVGPDQQAFIRKAIDIALRFGIVVWYDIYQAGFIWDHLVPIFHVLPGKVFVPSLDPHPMQGLMGLGLQQKAALSTRGFKNSDIKQGTMHEILWFLGTNPRAIVLSLSYATLWLVEPSSYQYVVLSHGVDEDHIWRYEGHKAEEAFRFPPVSFTRYAYEHGRRDIGQLAERLRPGRPVLLYIANKAMRCEDPSFFSSPPFRDSHCLPRGTMPSKLIIDGLNRLARAYNVVIRPHPRDLDSVEGGMKRLQSLVPLCIINNYKDAYSLWDLARLADVIVAEPSAVTSSLFYSVPTTPLVYLLRNRTLYECAKDRVINGSMAVILFPTEGNSSSNLLQAVRLAKANNGPSEAAARRAYFRRYFGGIDGYEEYRIVVNLFQRLALRNQDMLKETAALQELLARFSHVSRLGGVQIPICDRECCKP